MHFQFHLNKLQKAAHQLDEKLLQKKQLEVFVGLILNSVCIKLYKKTWTNQMLDSAPAGSSIFFSIWLSDEAIEKRQLLYNIHALKLRQLKGYTLESRKFAAAFREGFANTQQHWQNVSVAFGPLTLMQGWVNIDTENYEDEIIQLCNQFMQIDDLIDTNLAKFKK